MDQISSPITQHKSLKAQHVTTEPVRSSVRSKCVINRRRRVSYSSSSSTSCGSSSVGHQAAGGQLCSQPRHEGEPFAGGSRQASGSEGGGCPSLCGGIGDPGAPPPKGSPAACQSAEGWSVLLMMMTQLSCAVVGHAVACILDTKPSGLDFAGTSSNKMQTPARFCHIQSLCTQLSQGKVGTQRCTNAAASQSTCVL